MGSLGAPCTSGENGGLGGVWPLSGLPSVRNGSVRHQREPRCLAGHCARQRSGLACSSSGVEARPAGLLPGGLSRPSPSFPAPSPLEGLGLSQQGTLLPPPQVSAVNHRAVLIGHSASLWHTLTMPMLLPRS